MNVFVLASVKLALVTTAWLKKAKKIRLGELHNTKLGTAIYMYMSVPSRYFPAQLLNIGRRTAGLVNIKQYYCTLVWGGVNC